MMTPAWMRVALGATAVVNWLGALILFPGFALVRNFFGLPAPGHPIYLSILAEFIFIFGVAYAYCAFAGRASRVFVGVGAAGKLAFFSTLAGYYLAGDLPVKAVLAGSWDLLIGGLFVAWLIQTRRSLT